MRTDDEHDLASAPRPSPRIPLPHRRSRAAGDARARRHEQAAAAVRGAAHLRQPRSSLDDRAQLEDAPTQQVRIVLGVAERPSPDRGDDAGGGIVRGVELAVDVSGSAWTCTCSAPLPVRPRTLLLAKVAAVTTALLVTVLALHIAAGVAWPFALNLAAPAQTIPALTSDRPLPPVDAAGLEGGDGSRSRGGAEERPAGAGRGRRDRDWVSTGAASGACSRMARRRRIRCSKRDRRRRRSPASLLAHMAAERTGALDEPVRELLPELGIDRPERRRRSRCWIWRRIDRVCGAMDLVVPSARSGQSVRRLRQGAALHLHARARRAEVGRFRVPLQQPRHGAARARAGRARGHRTTCRW